MPQAYNDLPNRESRSLRGNVDRNIRLKVTTIVTIVVPYVGTWIEMITSNKIGWIKYGRSLRGNVDRNLPLLFLPLLDQVVPYVGTWIEISKSSRQFERSYVVPYVGTWIEISGK